MVVDFQGNTISFLGRKATTACLKRFGKRFCRSHVFDEDVQMPPTMPLHGSSKVSEFTQIAGWKGGFFSFSSDRKQLYHHIFLDDSDQTAEVTPNVGGSQGNPPKVSKTFRLREFQ